MTDAPIRVTQVIAEVLEHFDISLGELKSHKKDLYFRPRQIGMYLAKQLTTDNRTKIAHQFGCWEDAQTYHAQQMIRMNVLLDAQLAWDVMIISERLRPTLPADILLPAKIQPAPAG